MKEGQKAYEGFLYYIRTKLQIRCTLSNLPDKNLNVQLLNGRGTTAITISNYLYRK